MSNTVKRSTVKNKVLVHHLEDVDGRSYRVFVKSQGMTHHDSVVTDVVREMMKRKVTEPSTPNIIAVIREVYDNAAHFSAKYDSRERQQLQYLSQLTDAGFNRLAGEIKSEYMKQTNP